MDQKVSEPSPGCVERLALMVAMVMVVLQKCSCVHPLALPRDVARRAAAVCRSPEDDPPVTARSLMGDGAMQLMSVSADARHLGYKSRSQLYKLMNDGWLDAHVHIQMPSGQSLFDVDGLKKTLQGLFQWRVDSVFLRYQ